MYIYEADILGRIPVKESGKSDIYQAGYEDYRIKVNFAVNLIRGKGPTDLNDVLR